MADVCGQCEQTFETEENYLSHDCEKSGFTPRDPENLGDIFKLISENALKRGEARKAEDK
jgi:hypothetical protein